MIGRALRATAQGLMVLAAIFFAWFLFESGGRNLVYVILPVFVFAVVVVLGWVGFPVTFAGALILGSVVDFFARRGAPKFLVTMIVVPLALAPILLLIDDPIGVFLLGIPAVVVAWKMVQGAPFAPEGRDLSPGRFFERPEERWDRVVGGIGPRTTDHGPR